MVELELASSFAICVMENGFSSPRNDTFNPAGLRVLVVDDDLAWLKILEKMLKKCSYEVTTCGLARDALSLLRERKDGYDIVISDVNMPDMDGFKLLEHVGLEMDLPVIMMSVDGETSRVMKGVQHGACDYLLKPIRMKELRNIWQHVFRKRIHEVRDIENIEGFESIHMTRSGSDQSVDGPLLTGEDLTLVRKRKDAESRHDDRDCGDASSTKKARVVWSIDLHQKFVKAVNQIGFDKVGPKKILDLMNVPWLTRENVASHLQKYRLYLTRLQKDELKTSVGGIKQKDSPSKDSAASFGIQNSITVHHHNDVSNGGYRFSGSNSVVQNVDAKSLEGDVKGIDTIPVTGHKRVLTVDIPNSHKARCSQIGFNGSFVPGHSDVNFTSFDSAIPTQPWSEVSETQFQHEHKPLRLENDFTQLPLPGPRHHIQVDCIQSGPSASSKPSVVEKDINVKPFDCTYKSNYPNAVPIGSAVDTFPVQTTSPIVNHQPFEPIARTTSSMKSQGLNLSCIPDLEAAQRNINWAVGSSLTSLDEDLQLCWLQGDCFAMNLGLQDIKFSEHNDPALNSEVPFHLYDTMRFDYEHYYDPTECPIIDQGLFIA